MTKIPDNITKPIAGEDAEVNTVLKEQQLVDAETILADAKALLEAKRAGFKTVDEYTEACQRVIAKEARLDTEQAELDELRKELGDTATRQKSKEDFINKQFEV